MCERGWRVVKRGRNTWDQTSCAAGQDGRSTVNTTDRLFRNASAVGICVVHVMYMI